MSSECEWYAPVQLGRILLWIRMIAGNALEEQPTACPEGCCCAARRADGHVGKAGFV